MSALAIAVVTFTFAFGSALAGSYLRERLPEPHLTKESQDVVRLGMGLVATMTALLLGLVTAAARSTFDGHDTAVKNSAVNILTLDRHLARYGADTAPIRELLRRAVAFRVETTWPDAGGGTGLRETMSTAAVEGIETGILQLSPKTEAERWFRGEALKLSEEVLKARWRALGSVSAVPPAFLLVVIFWLSMTFASFGLYAPRNATVVSVLMVAAVSVGAALFLIVELDGPFDGLIRVSGRPLRFALDHLGE